MRETAALGGGAPSAQIEDGAPHAVSNADCGLLGADHMSTGTSQILRGAIVVTVMALSAITLGAQETSSSSRATPAGGDPANGRALVQSSKCLDCHRIGEAGSRLGP